jgi:hypothetical protein
MKTSLLVSLTLFVCLFSLGLFATTSPPPGPNQIPLDGGVLILLSAAAGYAANKLKKKEKDI